MQKDFLDLLALARENVERNPTIIKSETNAVAGRYLDSVIDEVKEVIPEVKENNAIYLTDELSDVAWSYAVTLALLEKRGLIISAQDVLDHAHTKFTQRSPAFLKEDYDLWNDIKSKQKAALKEQHLDTYEK